MEIGLRIIFVVFSVLPLTSSLILYVSYEKYLKKTPRIAWGPPISGCLIPISLLTILFGFEIIGVLIWIVISVAFWYSWKQTALEITNINRIFLGVGILEEIIKDQEEVRATSPGKMARGFLYIGLMAILPITVAVFDVILVRELLTETKKEGKG